jgi:hypothetical protein
MKTRFVWLASLLLAVGLLSLMVGCDRKEQTVSAPTPVQVDQPDSSVPSGEAEKATTAQKAWWRGLSQAGRNNAIVTRAYQDNNRNVGQNCKIWARAVVLAASQTVVNLPGTLPTENGWYFADSPYLVGMCGGIRSVQPGWIVQTNWKLADGSITPHTFIVVSRTSSGVNIIECNWTPLTVTTRFVPFTVFEGSVNPPKAPEVPRYTCYYVIGG